MPSGLVKGAYWRGNWTYYASIGREGGPSVNFSSIATTGDGRLYGISNDTVLEYTINVDPDKHTHFKYSGIVCP
jgi:hypothetical protein